MIKLKNNFLLCENTHGWFFFIIIIGVAIFLRFYNIEYVEFKGDEARNSFKALKFIKEGKFPLTSSISSTGINEPPAFMYLLSVPFIFSTSPVFATGFIALINVAGILLCFLFLKKYFSVNAGLIATAFYSVNPWQVLFSRKIWTQNLLAPFVVLFFFLMFKAITDKKKEFYIYASLALGIILQLHLSSAYFFLVFLLILILYYKEIDKKIISIGAVVFTLTFIPYLIFQVNSDFVDLKTLSTFLKQEPVWHFTAFSFPLLLFSTNGFQYSFGSDFNEFLNKSIKIPFFDYLIIGILFASVIILLYKPNKIKFVLVFWLFSGIFYLFTSKSPALYEHYFNSIFPAMFMITGISLASVIKYIPRFGRYILTSLIGILVVYQFLFSYYLLNFIKEKDCINGDYGVPYFYRKKMIEEDIKSGSTKYIEDNIQVIHENTCNCVKCDLPATHFIIKYLRNDYSYWPTPDD